MIDKDFSGEITIEEATDVLKSFSHGKDTLRPLIEAALSKGYRINSGVQKYILIPSRSLYV
jgi:hypothetical protein